MVRDSIGQARAVLFGPGTSAAGGSLEQQVSWLRKRQPNAAIAAIASDDDDRAQSITTRLSLQGYIPTSCGIEVAAATLRLIIAGGILMGVGEMVRWPRG